MYCHWVILVAVKSNELFIVRSWFGKWCIYVLPVQVIHTEKARMFTDPFIQNIDVVQADRIDGVLKLMQVPFSKLQIVPNKYDIM